MESMSGAEITSSGRILQFTAIFFLLGSSTGFSERAIIKSG